MYNQLIGSSQREKRRNKKIGESRIESEHSMKKRRETLGSTDSRDHSNELESEMPVSLVTPIRRAVKHKTEDVSIWDIQNNVKSRLKQKEIFLPQIETSPSHSRSISKNQPNIKYNSNNHKRFKEPTLKSRLKTYGNDAQLQDIYYDETIIQINELNDRFNRQNRRKKHDRKLYQDTRNIYGDAAAMRKKKFNHISRQQQFEQYVDYLENMYNKKRAGKTLEQREMENIEEKLMSRVETRHRNHQKLKESNGESKEKDAGNPEKSEENLTKSFNEKVRKEGHDTFIKILRKAKNRGESLLVKLSKYPSQKLMNK